MGCTAPARARAPRAPTPARVSRRPRAAPCAQAPTSSPCGFQGGHALTGAVTCHNTAARTAEVADVGAINVRVGVLAPMTTVPRRRTAPALAASTPVTRIAAPPPLPRSFRWISETRWERGSTGECEAFVPRGRRRKHGDTTVRPTACVGTRDARPPASRVGHGTRSHGVGTRGARETPLHMVVSPHSSELGEGMAPWGHLARGACGVTTHDASDHARPLRVARLPVAHSVSSTPLAGRANRATLYSPVWRGLFHAESTSRDVWDTSSLSGEGMPVSATSDGSIMAVPHTRTVSLMARPPLPDHA